MIHPSFILLNRMYPHPDPNKLKMDRWAHGTVKKIKAVYLLVLNSRVIKVGQSIDFYRRMKDYKYRVGHACETLTPALNKMIREAGEDLKVYVRFYGEELYRTDEWGEQVLQTDCVFAAEKKWKEYYKESIIFD